jgi:response regulator RpfG family c-di-GMP phosphodiesterase
VFFVALCNMQPMFREKKYWNHESNIYISRVPLEIGTEPMFILVDDDPTSTLVTKINIKKFLRESVVISFNNVADGLDFLESLNNDLHHLNPRVVMLDLRMPGSSGYDFLNRLNAMGIHDPELFIYVLSSTIDEREIDRVLDYETVAGFISKPLTIERLEDIFKHH